MFAMSIGAFAIGTAEFVVMGILPTIAASERVSLESAGHLVTFYAVGVVVGAPLLTLATTKIPRKPLLIGFMAFFAAANLATALAPNFEVLLASRFIAGLPHGAYFGVAAVVGSSLVPFERRARAVATVFFGLTVATVVGVPLSAFVVDQVSWRLVFVAIAVIGVITMLAVAATVPDTRGAIPQSNPAAEVRALNSKRVVLTLVTGMVGFGGMFACYTYLTPLLEGVTGFGSAGVAIALVAFGVGLTAGNGAGGQLADRRPVSGMYTCFAAIAVILLVMYFTVASPVMAVLCVFAMAFASSAVSPILARMLLDSAQDAPSLASSLHHSAFNLANANGAWLGGLVLGAGFGLTAPMLIGAALALAGLVLSFSLAKAVREAPVEAPRELVLAH
ncbi:MFS transporter [Glycomyces buryatensis]|uniref:MFS transporter n=1 Tax=Glycomyces buryatensis TaxID=2570927 RepID=A0A4S8QGQ0_9ACTN|nr:MFS transporter [Glycomyces buryatensis]